MTGDSRSSQRRIRPRAIKVKEFTGEDKKYTLDHFVGQVEAHRAYYDWTSKETGRIVRMNLGGEAQMALADLKNVPTDWEDLRKVLKGRFEPEGHEGRHRDELLSRRRKEGETLAQYVSDLRRLGRKGFPTMTRKDREDLLKGLFISGQGSDMFRESTLTQELGTLTQALQWAEKH